jgi:hypothetical protein
MRDARLELFDGAALERRGRHRRVSVVAETRHAYEHQHTLQPPPPAHSGHRALPESEAAFGAT